MCNKHQSIAKPNKNGQKLNWKKKKIICEGIGEKDPPIATTRSQLRRFISLVPQFLVNSPQSQITKYPKWVEDLRKNHPRTNNGKKTLDTRN